jgi:hypothetical protein
MVSQGESGGVTPMASMALTLPVEPPVVDFEPPQAAKSKTKAAATIFVLPVIASHGNSCFVAMPRISGEG